MRICLVFLELIFYLKVHLIKQVIVFTNFTHVEYLQFTSVAFIKLMCATFLLLIILTISFSRKMLSSVLCS